MRSKLYSICLLALILTAWGALPKAAHADHSRHNRYEGYYDHYDPYHQRNQTQQRWGNHDYFDEDESSWSNNNDYHRGRGHYHEVYNSISIDDYDRETIERYLKTTHYRQCPPGLSRKRNGCQPPGHAKKNYRIGYRLGDDVSYWSIPDDLYIRLSPIPLNYQYVQVDRDILLISAASKKVIDAVTLLSAINN